MNSTDYVASLSRYAELEANASRNNGHTDLLLLQSESGLSRRKPMMCHPIREQSPR